MKNEMNVMNFADRVRNEVFWQGYCCDVGIAEYNFEVSFRKLQREAAELGSEFLEIFKQVTKEKLGR